MILLLAGTGEAREIAAGLAARGVAGIASLAGATRQPAPLRLPTRTGGFGDEAGFRTFLAAHRVTAIIDATHPFAERITARTVRVAADLGLPCLRVDRPAWAPGPGDRWTEAPLDQAGAHIPAGARVFVASGRQTLATLRALPNHLFCRVIDPPDQPFPGPGAWVVGRPPFTEGQETALFRDLAIDWLVVKNAGGTEGWPKLAAARELGLPVLIAPRPALPPGLTSVTTAAAALDWALARCT
jgi:precorrin-6A/cobalt-precorrin-6A reductase